MNATDFRIGNLAKFRISDDVSESWRASRVDLDPEIANIVNDNYSKLLDDSPETHNVEQGDKYKLPDLDFSVSRKIREKYGDVIHELRMNDIRNLEKTLDYFSDHKDASK